MKDKFRDDIAARFLREARTFINELIEGTNNYRQLYSLSEQFPHDYHDRFLVELIQNANDASTGGEVRIVLDEISSNTPRLYVANQGNPFTLKNFEALCSLGLSDKDPNEAIGNKGLGFRSVLQICRDPHIYSATDGLSQDKSEGFIGYCFKLTPSARDIVTELIDEIQHKDTRAGNTSEVIQKYFGVKVPLLSEPSRIERLRSRIEKGECEVSEEVEYLSPYSFPLPLMDSNPILHMFHQEDFVTVIELTLNEPEDLMAAKRAIGKIVPEYLLFTPRLIKLSVKHMTHSDEENLSIVLEKKPIPKSHRFCPPLPLTGLEIIRRQNDVSLDNMPTREENGTSPKPMNTESRVWWIHTGIVTGEDLTLALQDLPGKWHEVTKAVVSIALERTIQEPQSGLFSIYLPTQQETGSPVSINGPFYGNLARTDINFSKEYNHLLLIKAVELLIEMLNCISTTGSLEDGTAMLDILDCRDSSSELMQLVNRRLEDSGIPLSHLNIIYLEPPDDGTHLEHVLAPISSIRILPESKQPRQFLTPSRLTKVGACFPASIITKNRGMVLNRLAEWVSSNLMPEDTEIAAWIEKLAVSLLKSSTTLNDWNIFYREISELNETSHFQDALRTCRFLLTEDQRLVAADGDGPRIFAFPVRTGTLSEDSDEEEQPSDSKPRVRIPSRIKPHIAFLHSGISLYEDRMFNSVGRFLRLGNPPMVRDYETRVIVNEVIIPLVIKASARNSVSSLETLAQSLSWAYQLYLSVPTDAAFVGVQWSRLYVPTISGWRPAIETYFSAKWTGTLGHLVEKAFPQGHQALDKLLVSPENFAKLVLGKSSSLGNDDLRGWIVFLRDQCNVLETPLIKQTVFRRVKPDPEQEHLRMSGYGSKYETTELGNFFHFPASVWSQYVEYLRYSLKPPLKGYYYYYLERMATLDGLAEVHEKTANSYSQLVARGFSKMHDSLTTGVTRRGAGVTISWAKADSSLAFALKHFPWLPYVSGDEADIKGLSDPDHIWFIPPDILDSPPSRMRYSFVNHLPKDVAQSMTDDFRQFLGLRAVKISSAEEGLILLADLASSWKTGLPPERHQFFIDLWRDALVETARLWKDIPPSEREAILQKSRERGLNGLLVTLAGRRFPEWRNLISEEELISLIHLPDEVELKSSMGEWVDIAEMRGEQIDSQVNLLKSLFGSNVACISQLEFVPESSEIIDLQHHLESAPPLTSRFPWLEAFALTIFGLGRSQEMNITGDDFRRVARNFRRLKYLEVPGLQLRIKGLDTIKPPLSPTCYYWDKYNALLLDPGTASNCEDLVGGLRAFFGVQDIEPPLRLALSKLGHPLDDIDPPEHELQVQSLQFLHVSPEQFARIRRIVASGDDEWISIRLVPAICALSGITKNDEANKIREDFLELSASLGIEKALQGLGLSGMSVENPAELYELAAGATGDEDMAYKLWSNRRLSLAVWNDSIRALGHPYRICHNNNIEDEFYIIVQELKPVVIAVMRKALKRSGAIERYVSLKDSYDEITPQADWEEQFWQLPLGVVIETMRCWFISQIPDVETELLDVLSVSADSIQQVRLMATNLGLDLDHNDDLMEQQNRLQLESLIESCLTHILAAWIASGHEKSPVPTVVSNARESGNLLSQDNVRSLCQFEPISEVDYMNMVVEYFTEQGVFEQLGIDKKPWDSLVSLTGDLPATKEQLELAAERLKKVQEYNERRARMRSILGVDYEMPRGDLFEGLRDVVDTQLSGELLTGVDLFRDPSLGEAPKPTPSGGRGRGRGKGGGLSPKDRDLIGAVGEYIIYKVLCSQIGVSAAGQAWKSRNRRHFLADDTGDDALGYDFEFPREGMLWQIEVKSSRGDPQFVDLSDTEVEAARSAAKRRSRKNYVVYLVENALSQPEVYPLGNPFVTAGKTRFHVEEGGARVYFKLSRNEDKPTQIETQP